MQQDRSLRPMHLPEFRRLRYEVALVALLTVFLIAAIPPRTPAEVTGRGVASPAGGPRALRSDVFSLTGTTQRVGQTAGTDTGFRSSAGVSADGLVLRHVVAGAEESGFARASGDACPCGGGGLFSDGFESGGTANWSSTTN